MRAARPSARLSALVTITLVTITLVTIMFVLVACTGHPTARPTGTTQARNHSRSTRPTRSTVGAAAVGDTIHRSVFGHSVQGRELVAFRVGPVSAPRRVLVVGVIHGDETAGLVIAQDLLRAAPQATTEVVVVPDLNPDGVALGTRQNARGVDLNRNFPYSWTELGPRGGQQYSGSGPLSEPESGAVADLIRRLRPTVSVWFHQPVGVVDESGGGVGVESRFARITGLPLKRMPRYHGSVASWENSLIPGSTAFVVELPRHVSALLGTRVLRGLRAVEN